MKSSESLSYGWSPNSTNIGWDTTSRHCRRYFKSTAESWREEPLKGKSPRASIACVLPWEKVKFTGCHSPRQMSSTIRSGGLPMAGRPECMKSPPSLRNPCQKWEDLEYGKAAPIHQRTQQVLKAARLSLLTDGCRTKPSSVACGGSCSRCSRYDSLPTCQGWSVCGRLNKRTSSTSQ